jgi:VanZ family protein
MIRFLFSWGPASLWAGFIFWLSSQTWEDGPVGFEVPDKVVHLILFGILGLALAWGGRHLQRKGVQIGLVLLGILYAVTDEWHQSFVPLRDPSVGDFAADAVGVILGFLIGKALFQTTGLGRNHDI